MKRALIWILLFSLLFSFYSCATPQPEVTRTQQLPPVVKESTQAAPVSSTAPASTSAQTEELPTEEEETRVDQMNKDQVSKTYQYIKDIVSNGVYYLRFTSEVKQDFTVDTREYVLASDGKCTLIEERSDKMTYWIRGNWVTILNEKEGRCVEYDITGSEFSLENIVDWLSFGDYAGVAFTVTSAGTKRRPKLTESFQREKGNISFYYYKDALSTVSGTDSDGSEWTHTIKEFHNRPKAAVFTIPAKYGAKNTQTP